MRNEISASERRSWARSSMESRLFCVILRGLTTLDTRSVVADRAKNQNDRRSYEHGEPFVCEHSDRSLADPRGACMVWRSCSSRPHLDAPGLAFRNL